MIKKKISHLIHSVAEASVESWQSVEFGPGLAESLPILG